MTHSSPIHLAKLTTVLALLGPAAVLAADERPPIDYSREVAPLFKKYCTACHNEDDAKGGLVLESYETLLDGGNTGDVVVAGKSDASRLVKLLEGKEKLKMPPKDSPQPKPEEIALIKAWIDAGAKGPAAPPDVAKGEPAAAAAVPELPAVPDVKPTAPVQPAVNAVAFYPSGKLLAVGRYREVLLIDPADGRRVASVDGMRQDVSSVVFSADGRLLVAAGGAPAQFGQLLIARITAGAAAASSDTQAPVHVEVLHNLYGHSDAIESAAVSPDGTLVATGSYDQLIKLWDVATGAEKATLKDHTGAVYAVAFSPDGSLLASAAGDSSVKIWDVATGKRLYTMGQPLDYVYCVAFHPSGKQVAAGGADKRVRVWNVTRDGATLAESAFAHDGPVLRLAYSADGRHLYSSGEDHRIKLWQAESLVEERVLEPQPDWAAALALSPMPAGSDGAAQQLAVGRYDGSLALYDSATGDHLRDLLAAAPKLAAKTPPAASKPADDGNPKLIPASLGSVSPKGIERGKTVRLTLRGARIGGADAIYFTTSHLTGKLVPAPDGKVDAGKVEVDVTADADTPPGVYRLFLRTPLGSTGSLPLAVTPLPELAEAEPNDTPEAATPVTLPATLIGTVASAAERDCFSFSAEAGSQLVFDAETAAIGSSLNAVMELIDSAGRTVASNHSSAGDRAALLACTVQEAGTYVLRVSDREYRGGGNFDYRVHAGALPFVTGVFPPGVQRGASVDVKLAGYNLPAETVHLDVPADLEPGATLPLPLESSLGFVLGRRNVVVGDAPEVTEQDAADPGAQLVTVPVTINGSISTPAAADRSSEPDTDTFRFAAKKDQAIAIEVTADRLGSRLDSLLEVLDADGKPVPRATLRAVAETYIVLRDHGSKGDGLRIQSWNDLAVNDFVMVGGEVLQVDQLPRGPDDNVVFRSFRGQRLGLLGTTPQAHALGASVYKVQIHPPGSTFPPNGLPLTEITYRNDDGGPQYGSDSFLFFTPPADGDYAVRLSDVRGLEGDDFFYRLALRAPREDYRLSISPANPNVPAGGSVPLTVTAERLDGFDGPIDVWVEGLPEGVSCTKGVIPQGEFTATLALAADGGGEGETRGGGEAESAAGTMKLVGRAAIGEREVVHESDSESTGGIVCVLPEPDVRVAVEPAEVEIVPGQEKVLTVHVERRGGFAQRVPINIVNLPQGVRVLDVGLNGVLVTEDQTSRNFVLYAEPWAPPVTRPFYAVGNVESSPPTQNASAAIQLRVAPRPQVAQESGKQ